MKILLAVLAISGFAAQAEGFLEPGLRVKYGSFFNVSLTVFEARAAGWCLTRRPYHPTPHLPQLTMYCAPGNCLCAFYDDNGHVGGIQVSLPKEKFKNNTFGWENRGFQLWRTIVNKKCIEMYATQQYFISEEYMKKSKEELLALRDSSRLLQENAIWITGFNRELMKLSDEEDILSQGFIKQACHPSMGQHFMYKITPKTTCEDENFLPWFVMTMKGKIVTSAFNNFGSLPIGTQEDYFERSNRSFVEDVIAPYAPECLYDLVDSPGLITMHIYYTSTPLLVTC